MKASWHGQESEVDVSAFANLMFQEILPYSQQILFITRQTLSILK